MEKEVVASWAFDVSVRQQGAALRAESAERRQMHHLISDAFVLKRTRRRRKRADVAHGLRALCT
jgi:hypothetical protein